MKPAPSGFSTLQPAPVKNTSPAIQDLVIMDVTALLSHTVCDQIIADIEARKVIGMERYGTLLQAHNGRDAKRDAYEEALDLVQYLRQALEEGLLNSPAQYKLYTDALLLLETLRGYQT